MPLDVFHAPDAAGRPVEPLARLQARALAAEAALARAPAPGPMAAAAREAFRDAHARLCAARDAFAEIEAEGEDPDAWPEEPAGD